MTTKCSDCKPLGQVAEWADDIKVQRSALPSHAAAIECDPEYMNRTIVYGNDATYRNNVITHIVEFSMDLQQYTEGRFRRRRKLFLSSIIRGVRNAFDSLDEALDEALEDKDRESLMFLSHMMGDLHQPLHCGCRQDSDGLRIGVNFFNYLNLESHPFPLICMILPAFLRSIIFCDLNLHLVWDNSIITRTLNNDFSGSRKDLEDDIWNEYIEGNEAQMEEWISCFPDAGSNTTDRLDRQQITDCVLEWANESLQLALEYSYHDADGRVVVTGSHLEQEYYERALHVVRRQLAAGAVRFATLLKHVLREFEDPEDATAYPSNTVLPPI